MLKVPYGQDAYSVIGKYIRDHITAIEDIIAVIEIDGITTNQLFMVDMNEENYFIWNNDWYEGEKSVALIDFFPVSEAINPSAQPEQRWIPVSDRLPEVRQWVLCQCRAGIMDVLRLTADGSWEKTYPHIEYMSGFVVAWMPLPEAYKG